MTNLKKLKDQIFNEYKKWCKENIHCPALEEPVNFTLLGWNHLVRPNGKSRNKKDLYRRLKLLQHAKYLISKSTTIQDISIENEHTYFVIEAVVYNDKNIPKKVRIIIMDTKTGKKFYSIMDLETRSRRKQKCEMPQALVRGT